MCIPSCNTNYTTRKPTHVHRRGMLCYRAGTQLPKVVTSPTLDATTVGQCTGVLMASRDSNYATGQSIHIHRCCAILGRTITKLTSAVTPPAFDPAPHRQCAGVLIPHCNGCDPIRQPAHVHWRETVSGRAIAELAKGVKPPTLDTPCTGYCAGVRRSRSAIHSSNVTCQPSYKRWSASVESRAIPQLSAEVISPTFDAAVAGE